MSNEIRLAAVIEPPVQLALLLICEKCGRRITDSKKNNPSHHLASKLKRIAKHEFGKGHVRAVLTSCLDLCPDDRVAVALVPTTADAPTVFFKTDVADIDAAAHSLMRNVRRLCEVR